ncbi:MAG: nucleotidyltransferase family protein, partial [Deltaproteobacteria bacterium]|nr:nucleotidyltransferase family protein [Deltaproteobacteria bacterium]
MTFDVNDTVRFLRSASRISLRESDKEYLLAYVKKDVSWKHLLLVAHANGVDGLLYYHLKNLKRLDVLPQPVAKKLEETYRQTTRHVFATISALKSISVGARQAKIPVLALQGITLIKLYRDPGIRPFVDADVMVRSRHKERFRRLLLDE